MVEIEKDVAGLSVGLTEVDENVDFLFDEQVIQDERLLELEQTSDDVVVELAEINVELLGMITTIASNSFFSFSKLILNF